MASSFFITFKLFKISNFIDSLISWFIVYLAQIVLGELILGILGILYLKNVILLNLAIFLITWLITRNKPVSYNLNEAKTTFLRFLENKIVLFCLSIVLSFSLVKISINLMNPPFGWDNLNYHFTFPVEWLKHGNLDTPIIVSDDPAPTYYPINGNLFFLWLIFPLKNVFLADLGQVPFFILAFLALFGISRRMNLNRELSFYAATLFLIIPNFLKQLEIAYVDVMVCALFLTGLFYTLKLNSRFQLSSVILAAISMGLLIGTKTLALVYSLPLFLAIFYLCMLNIKERGLVYLLIFMFLLILFGGFNYIRNFIWTGNPLYPIDIQIFGKTIFKGVVDRINYSIHFLPEDYRISKLLFHEGLGLQTILFILPGSLLSLPLIFIKAKKTPFSVRLYFLATLPFILYLIWRYVIPLANTRYLYPALAVGVIMGFYPVNLLKVPLKFISTLVVICVLTSASELAGHKELFVSLMSGLTLFFLLIKKLLRMRFIILIFLTSLIILPFLESDYRKNEYRRYKNTPFWQDSVSAWIWLNDNTWQDNICYVGRPVPFPLYGSGFKNNVYYVSVNSVEPAKLHFFKNSRYIWDYDFETCHKNYEAENNYRGKANYKIWLSNLKRRNTDYLFVYSLHQIKGIKFPVEDGWARLHPEAFEPVFSNNTIHIYKIR
jgi:hypothetical protein